MSKSVNLYEIMHGFWKENDYKPFPASATALFFFLLDRANSRHWKMPVRCPTSLVCRAINVSKQTALAARESLMRRGLITFSKGTGKDNLPSYIIVTDPDKWTDSRTDSHTERMTGDLTDNRTVSRTPNLTPSLTENLTQYNMKDINIKDKIYPIYKDGEQKFLSLDELEVSFLSDTAWQADLVSLLSGESAITEPDLKERITFFFRQLRCQGTDRREEKDCRTHFVNWIKKQLNNNKDGIHKQQWEPDKRRGSGVSATSARDYDERFKLPMSQEQAHRLLLAAVKGEVEYRSRKFEMNEELDCQVRTIAECLTGESPKFGLLLCGGVGNGKSTVVKAFQQLLNQLNLRTEDNRECWGFRIMDARSVNYLCKSAYREWEELCMMRMLAIDDLGIESLEIQDYGNIMSPMVDLLTRRYDKQLFTIITTNLTPQEIRAKYGDRIADRFNEMMVKIVFENPTYRTKDIIAEKPQLQ